MSLPCRHETCHNVTNEGKIARYYCHTNGGLSKHHRKRYLHPCCAGDDPCKIGKRIKVWSKVPKRMLRCVSRDDAKGYSFQCEHSSCERLFSIHNSKIRHQEKPHPNCDKTCTVCDDKDEEVPVDFSIPTDPGDSETESENESMKEEKHDLLKPLSSLDFKLTESNFVKELTYISPDSIIITRNSNGDVEWSNAITALKKRKRNKEETNSFKLMHGSEL